MDITGRLLNALGLRQNAARIQHELQDELNIQLETIGRQVSHSAKAGAFSFAALMSGAITVVFVFLSFYKLLAPYLGAAGSAGVLAILGLVITAGLVSMARGQLQTMPSRKSVEIPQLYVPVETATPPPLHERNQRGAETARPSGDLSGLVSSFLVDEMQRKLETGSASATVKNLSAAIGPEARPIIAEAVQGLESQLAHSSAGRKYAILGAAVFAGILLSRT